MLLEILQLIFVSSILVIPGLPFIGLSALNFRVLLYKPSSIALERFVGDLRPPISTLYTSRHGNVAFVITPSSSPTTLLENLEKQRDHHIAMQIGNVILPLTMGGIFIGIPTILLLTGLPLVKTPSELIKSVTTLTLIFTSLFVSMSFGRILGRDT